MDKAQAIDAFWNSFDLPAYDEATVPIDDRAPDFPYITYGVSTDSIGNVVVLNGSLWYRTSSWELPSKKAEQIAKRIAENGFVVLRVDDGYIWVTKGTPFAQRMSDPEDDMIRRIYLTLNVEYLTAY